MRYSARRRLGPRLGRRECGWIDDGVEPEAGGGVARVGLVIIGGFDGVEEFFFGFFVDLFAFAFELFQLISARVLAAASPLMTANFAVGQANMKRGS